MSMANGTGSGSIPESSWCVRPSCSIERKCSSEDESVKGIIQESWEAIEESSMLLPVARGQMPETKSMDVRLAGW